MGAILAAAVAPAIVRADSLMRIVSRETLVAGSGSLMVDMAMESMLQQFVVQTILGADSLRLVAVDPRDDGSYMLADMSPRSTEIQRVGRGPGLLPDFAGANLHVGDVVTIAGITRARAFGTDQTPWPSSTLARTQPLRRPR